MRQGDYFEYDGSIASRYSLKSKISEKLSEKLQRLRADDDFTETETEPETEPVVIPPDTEPSAPEVITVSIKDVKRESPETNGTHETSADDIIIPDDDDGKLSSEELAAAIKAFGSGENQAKAEKKPEPKAVIVKEHRRIKNTLSEKRKKRRQREKTQGVSKLKRFFITVLLFIMLVAIVAGVIYILREDIRANNARQALFNSNADKVCTDYINKYGKANYENLYDSYGVEGYRLTGLCFVRVLDFNNDGESELMLAYNKNGVYYNEVWGNSGKEFKLLFSDLAAQREDKSKDAYSVLYRKNNKYYIAKFEKPKNNKMKLYQFKGGQFVEKFSCVYDELTQSYAVDGKDDTVAFERIKYAVLKEEKALVCTDTATKTVESFSSNGLPDDVAGEEKSMHNAYYSVVQEYNKRYGAASYVDNFDGTVFIDGLASVKLVDFDGDGTEELFLAYRKPIKIRKEKEDGESILIISYTYCCDIYRYSSNRAVLAYSNDGLSDKLNDDIDVYYMIRYSGKKAYYCMNSFNVSDYGNHITAASVQLEFDGAQFTSFYKASYYTDYGYTKYYIDGENVDKYIFNEDGYALPFFDGGEDYDSDVFFVTYLQRRKTDASDLRDVVSATEQEIRKLNQLYNPDTYAKNQ